MLSFEASYFYLLAVGITLVNFFKKIYFTKSTGLILILNSKGVSVSE